MKTITLALAAVLAAALVLPAIPALSQNREQGGISLEEARRIAMQNGMASIEEIERDDGKWEIEGRDATDRELEIDISAETGKVLKIEKD